MDAHHHGLGLSHCLHNSPSLGNTFYDSNEDQKCGSVSCQERDNPPFLAHSLYNPIFLEINILRIFQCIHILSSIFSGGKTELHVGFSKVLTATAKWWNKLSECFSSEKCFFACFITLTLQSSLLTDGYSQEFILPPLNTCYRPPGTPNSLP